MEFLSPVYICILHVRQSIEGGISVRDALAAYMRREPAPLAKALSQMLLVHERKGSLDIALLEAKSKMQRVVFRVFWRGLEGEPILHRLIEIEEELLVLSQNAVERHLQRLPVLMLIPLLGLIFPAVIMVLIGPLFLQLLARLD